MTEAVLHLPPRYLQQVQALLRAHLPNAQIWAYGSRVNGDHYEASDLDLVVRFPEAMQQTRRYQALNDAKAALSESDLPIIVQIVDWDAIPHSFHDEILVRYVVVQGGAMDLGVMGGWTEERFGSLVRLVSDKSPTKDANINTYISTENMLVNFGGIVAASALPPTGNVNRFKAGDTLFSNIRTYFKKVWKARFDGYCSNDVLVLRPENAGALTPDYLHQICRWQQFTEMSIRTSKGAKMPRGDKDALADFTFLLPPIKEQRAIADILGALDDKIALLGETNATLEAMAQALFKSWFVDFDPVRAKAAGREPDGMPPEVAALFPSEFEHSELGEIPKGWGVVALGDVAQQGKGAVNPGNSPQDAFTHYSLPAFDSAQMPVVELGSTIKSNKTPVPNGAVLVSKLNPHIPRIWHVGKAGENAVCSTEFIVWTPRPPANGAFLYCLASSRKFNSAMRQLVTGTSSSHQRVKPEQFRDIRVFTAIESVIEAFSEVVRLPMEQVLQNLQQSRTLAQLRDTLLPRLISGQLRIPKIKNSLGELAP